ncbi:MAG: hypothetical protein Q7J79_04730, partial [Gemmatimonadales bacterium]|nr:hypothetical protein [Gemmatimonadales bacterium]
MTSRAATSGAETPRAAAPGAVTPRAGSGPSSPGVDSSKLSPALAALGFRYLSPGAAEDVS